MNDTHASGNDNPADDQQPDAGDESNADQLSAADETSAADEHSGEPQADAADATDEDEPDPELIDQLGIPMRREPTLDDVRTDGAQHRQLAFGCTLLVSLAVIAFWLVRGILLSE